MLHRGVGQEEPPTGDVRAAPELDDDLGGVGVQRRGRGFGLAAEGAVH